MPRPDFCLSLLWSSCPYHYLSTLVSQGARTLLTYHNEVLTAFSRDNFMTSFCASLPDLSYLGQAMLYPLALSCLIPLWLRFSCDSFPCSFVSRSLPCFWSALACFDFGHCPATAQVRLYSSLPLYLSHSSCPTAAIPSQCRADLPWHFPGLSWLCLSLGCPGPALTLLTLLYLHCSSMTPKSSLDCVCVMA